MQIKNQNIQDIVEAVPEIFKNKKINDKEEVSKQKTLDLLEKGKG